MKTTNQGKSGAFTFLQRWLRWLLPSSRRGEMGYVTRRTTLRSISPTRRKQMIEYAKLRAAFLAQHPPCQRCGKHIAVDIHHKKGRIGSLLCDVENWVALCRTCHNWVQDHPEDARKAGLLCEKGQWNKTERVP